MRYAKWKNALAGFMSAGFGSVALGVLILGLAPVQAQAVEVCNSNIVIYRVDGATPFFEGDSLTLKATIGAGLIRDDNRPGAPDGDNPYIDYTGIGYGVDCGGGPMNRLSDCTPVGHGDYPPENTGHDIEFLGVTYSDCPTDDPDEDARWPLPESDNIVSIPVLNGVVRQHYHPKEEKGDTCSIDVSFTVHDMHESTNWVEQALGVPFDNRTPDESADDMKGTCSNDLSAAGYGKTVFQVQSCGIEVIKQVSIDGENWFDADTEGAALRMGPEDTAYYRLVVKNTSTVDFTGDLHVTDPLLGVDNLVTPAFDEHGEMILFGEGSGFDVERTCAQLLETGEGFFTNSASVTGTCRGSEGSDDWVWASDLDVAVVDCFKDDPRLADVELRKYTNGEDANSPTGPYIPVGDPVTWTYEIENTGNEGLTIDSLIDVPEGAVVCADTFLAAGETTTCTHLGVATVDQYSNSATVTATSDYTATVVQDTDPSHYFGMTSSIDLVKTAFPTLYSEVNEPITYTFAVTNTSNVVLINVHVTDPLPDMGGIVCPKSELAPAETMECEATYLIKDTDLANGSVDNTATAHGTDPVGGEVTDTDSAHIYTTPVYVLTLDKTAVPLTYSAAGEVIAYSYLLTNDGNQPLYKPYSVEDNRADVVCPAEPAVLDPGASVVCTAAYTILDGDIGAGSVTNVATGKAHSDPGAGPEHEVPSNEDRETVYYTNIAIRKKVWDSELEDFVDANTPETAPIEHYPANAEYQIIVENIGVVDLVNVVVEDFGLGLNYPVGALAAGATATIGKAEASELLVVDRCVDKTTIDNTATATGAAATSGQVVSASDVAWFACVGTPDIAIKKYIWDETLEDWVDGTATAVEVPSGAVYRITVENTGEVDLVGVTVSDPWIPGGPYDVGDLAVGVLVTITEVEWPALRFDTDPDTDNPAACTTTGTYKNIATANGTSADNPADTDSDSDDATLECIGPPSITIVKEVSLDDGLNWHDANDPPFPWAVVDGEAETAEYRLTVGNEGTVTLFDVVVNDAELGISDHLVGTLEPGTWVVLDSGDIPALSVPDICDSTGEKANVAFASGRSEAGSEDQASDSATVVCIGEPAIRVVKEVSDDGYVWGTEVTTLAPSDAYYRITVSNIGNVDLENVVINDGTLGIVDFAPVGADGAGMLNKGETVVITSGELDSLFVPTACTEEDEILNEVDAYGEAVDSSKTVTDIASALLICENPVDICEEWGRPSVLKMEYDGTSESDNAQGVVGVPDIVDLPVDVAILAYDKDTLEETYFKSIGEPFNIWGSWTPSGKIPPNIKLEFWSYYWDDTDPQNPLRRLDTKLQTVNFHGSCSAALIVGDSFGGAMITGYTP